MQPKYQKIWELALPYLKEGVRKDYAVHTRCAVEAMELLLEKEEGDAEILIPLMECHSVIPS